MVNLQIDNPSPEPCANSFSFSNLSNTCRCFSLGMPQPVSDTENITLFLFGSILLGKSDCSGIGKFSGIIQQIDEDLL